tara:strand:- start:427 stop:1206 length:780 start_codon:yes stop_codon:yes gene_type:complete
MPENQLTMKPLLKQSFLVLTISFLLVSCVSNEKKNVSENVENQAALSTKGNGDWWEKRHQKIVGRLEKNPQLILVGNSIFHTLDNEDRNEVWEKHLDQYQTVNMGISGDRTENVIWRLQNGTIDNINPKVALVLIGTNNTDGNHYLNISTPEELEGGIWKICEILRQKLPDTKIILLGILPYGYKPNHRDNINKATNKLIAKFPERDVNISYRNIEEVYLNEEGKVRKELMPDFLHPNAEGHLLMFDALEKDITALMNE